MFSINEYSDQHMAFKSALRKKVFTDSLMLSKALRENTEFVYSEEYPTQVINNPSTNTRYIRINKDDIHEDTIDELLSIMLGIENYDEDTENYNFLDKSIQDNKELDGRDPSKYTLLDVDPLTERVVSHTVPVQPQKVITEGEDPEELETLTKEAEECKLTEDTKTMASVMSQSTLADKPDRHKPYDTTRIPDLEQVEQSLDNVRKMQVDYRIFQNNKSVLSLEDIAYLHRKKDQLLKAFRGSKGRIKRMTPSKKLSGKDMAIDRDKVYYQDKSDNGKHIKLNLLIDMSGSMSGDPVRNAVSIVYLFNLLAKEGYVKCKVIYSNSSYSHILKLPVSDEDVLKTSKTGSSEGLAANIQKHQAELAHTNCICITDGDIVDEPIKKQFWSKHKIVSTGVYVNESAKNPLKYSGKLNKWFNHSIVRQNLDELVEWLVRVGLKG